MVPCIYFLKLSTNLLHCLSIIISLCWLIGVTYFMHNLRGYSDRQNNLPTGNNTVKICCMNDVSHTCGIFHFIIEERITNPRISPSHGAVLKLNVNETLNVQIGMDAGTSVQVIIQSLWSTVDYINRIMARFWPLCTISKI